MPWRVCRRLHLRSVSGRCRVGSAQRASDGAVSQGALHPAACRPYILGELGAASLRAVARLRVSRLQETSSHGPHLHRTVNAQDGCRPGSLDHARSRTALRHQIASFERRYSLTSNAAGSALRFICPLATFRPIRLELTHFLLNL